MKFFTAIGILLIGLLVCVGSQASGQITQASVGSTLSKPVRSRGNADVVFVKAVQSKSGTWRFDVSISHPDAGWKDYANGWDVVQNGKAIRPNGGKFTRVLAHPHVGQSLFTRSQGRLIITANTVTIRAHDMVDGFGGKEIIVDLTKDKGAGFTVWRNS